MAESSLKFAGPQTRALCGSPKQGTNGPHIRKKPLNPDERLLQDRSDKNARYSALVWAVLVDRTLEPIDWGVFSCLASRAFETDTMQMGSRWIAETLHIKKGRVQASIRRLLKGGHIEIVVAARGSRAAVYRLTSPVFSCRQKVIVSDVSGNHETTRYELDRRRELAKTLRTA